MQSRLVCAAIVALLLPGCFGPVTTFSEADVELLSCGEPCGFELDLTLKAGQDIEWVWSATQVVRFDLHQHQGQHVTNWVVRQDTGHTGSFKVLSPGEYSLFWRHTNPDPAYLSYTVKVKGEVPQA